MELSTVRKLKSLFEKLCEHRTSLIFVHQHESNAENVYAMEEGKLTRLKSS